MRRIGVEDYTRSSVGGRQFGMGVAKVSKVVSADSGVRTKQPCALEDARTPTAAPNAGLCDSCRHQRVVHTTRGSRF